MTCKECSSSELKLVAQFISYNADADKDLLNEVYECANCGNIRTIKSIG
jgi:uncharacterized Zn finger protein